MSRLHALVAVALILSFSGVASLAFPEPCSSVEQIDDHGTDCAPTCPTCGCCGQALEPTQIAIGETFAAPTVAPVVTLPGLPEAVTADGTLRTLPSFWPEAGGMDGFFAARLRRLPGDC